MGKRVICLTAALFLSGMSTFGTLAETDNQPPAGSGELEQVILNLPEAAAYGSGFTAAEAQKAAAFIGEKELQFEGAAPFSETGIGMEYDVLLDVSGSIPNQYLEGIKAGIQNLQNSLRPEDRLVLGTIGEQVSLVADGSQDSGTMEQILTGLNKKDQKTLLYEAVSQMAKQEGAASRAYRRVLVVVSDGEDDANAGNLQRDEALTALERAGIPAYAVCIQDTKKENIDQFGEFARNSGGRLITISPEQGASSLTALGRELLAETCIRFQAADNRITNQKELFKLELADGRILTREVMNIYSQADREAPALTAAVQEGTDGFLLTFSEPVDGLELAANYQVRLNGELKAVSSVTSQNSQGTEVALILQAPLETGSYEISCTNIVDRSMEKNPVVSEKTVEVSGVEQISEPEPKAEAGLSGVLLAAVGAVLLIAVVAGAILAAAASGSKKKQVQNPVPAEPNLTPDNLTVPAEERRQHIRVPKKRLNVSISTNGAYPKDTVWEISQSLFVGRQQKTCDICVEDTKLSKQHFALTWENNMLMIEDLHSTNGTSVNGIRIHAKRRLESGDTIHAGSMKIIIHF